MPPRRRTAQRFTPDDFMPDPIADALAADREGIADDFVELLKALDGIDDSRIYCSLYRMPDGGLGKFQWLEDLAWPFDVQTLRPGVKSKYGGGKYRLQTFVDKITKKNVEFSIAGETKQAGAPGGHAVGSTDMMGLFFQMQENARRDEASRRADELAHQRLADERRRDRNAMLIQAAIGVAPIVAPLIMANRDKLADTLAVIKAARPEGGNNSLKETLEVVGLVKKLFGDDKAAEFDPGDIAGSLARMAGPALKGIASAFRPAGGAVEDADSGYAPEPLELPAPNPAPESRPAAPAAPAAGPADPVLALIKPHVLYFFSAELDPQLAAEAIADIIERNGVSGEQINDLVAAFFASGPGWKDDLAGQGIDLRGNPQWADDFLAELVAQWSGGDADGGHRAGRAGSVADAGNDAATSAPGLADDDSARASA